MRPSGLFYGTLFLLLAYLVTIPNFDVSVIPGLINVPIPNPLFVFSKLAIIIVAVSILCFVYGFGSDKKQQQ